MTKSDVKQVLKKCMKEHSFSVRNGRYYKMVNENYLVGVWLDHSPYSETYFIEYGVIFLPDSKKMPFTGWCDWSDRFWFTTSPEEDITNYPLEIIECVLPEGVDHCLDYPQWAETSLAKQIQENIHKRVMKVMNKDYVLSLYVNNWFLFRSIPYETVKKITDMTGLDYDEVVHFRDYGGAEPK